MRVREGGNREEDGGGTSLGLKEGRGGGGMVRGTGGIGEEIGIEGERLEDRREGGEGLRCRIGSRWARIRASGRGRVPTRRIGTKTCIRL